MPEFGGSANIFLPERAGFAPVWKYALIIALLGLSQYLDYVTGYQVFTHFLYVFPIALSVFFFGKWSGACVVLASTACWAWADHASGHQYANSAIFYWNTFIQAAFFFLALLAMLFIRHHLDQSRARLQAFSGNIPICMQCHKIGSPDGYWSDFENYLRENSDVILTNKICPACARETYARGTVTMDGQSH